MDGLMRYRVYIRVYSKLTHFHPKTVKNQHTAHVKCEFRNNQSREARNTWRISRQSI